MQALSLTQQYKLRAQKNANLDAQPLRRGSFFLSATCATRHVVLHSVPVAHLAMSARHCS